MRNHCFYMTELERSPLVKASAGFAGRSGQPLGGSNPSLSATLHLIAVIGRRFK